MTAVLTSMWEIDQLIAPAFWLMWLDSVFRPQQGSLSNLCDASVDDGDVQVRRVRIAPKDSRRIDRVYIVGIEVRMGKGRYRNTQIVTLSPRFQLHNLSPYRIQYSQRCFATSFQVWMLLLFGFLFLVSYY